MSKQDESINNDVSLNTDSLQQLENRRILPLELS